jgi:hypothetical protein
VIVEASVGFASVAIIRACAMRVVAYAGHKVVLADALVVSSNEGPFVSKSFSLSVGYLFVDVSTE